MYIVVVFYACMYEADYLRSVFICCLQSETAVSLLSAIFWSCGGEVLRYGIYVFVRLHICPCHIVTAAAPNGQLGILLAVTGIVSF